MNYWLFWGFQNIILGCLLQKLIPILRMMSMFHDFICHFIGCNMVLVQWLFHSIRYNYSKLCSQFSTSSSGGSKVLSGVPDLGLFPCMIADVIPCKKWRCRNLVNLLLCSMFFLYDYSWKELVKLCTTS